MPNDETLGVESVQETRIAVSFYGGVALAVYESGVAIELFRLVNAEDEYAELTRYTGKVVTDVITGTSAGGLNGAFLANALVNRGDVLKLLDLWRDEGSLDKLLYDTSVKEPNALLDGVRFADKIFNGLLVKRAEAPGREHLQSRLDLFVTATNLDGSRAAVETPDGITIPTRTHRQVFHFRYKGTDRDDDDSQEINDFATDEDLRRLAIASRASASFPLAFEPVEIERTQMGERASALDANAYHIDGGVLDNKPIALATQAIAERQANKKISRLLFYVEPDPEQVETRVGLGARRTYTPWEVIIKALVSLPSYQSITAALEDIVKHNSQVQDRLRMMNYYEAAAASVRVSSALGSRADTPASQAALIEQDEFVAHPHPADLVIGARREAEAADGEPTPVESLVKAFGAVKFVPSVDRQSALYRSLEDGYLDLRLKDLSPRLFESLERINGQLHSLTQDGVAKAARASAMERLYYIKRVMLDEIDLKYHRRLYRYLIDLLENQYETAATQTYTAAPWRLQLVKLVNGLKDFLYTTTDLLRQHEVSGAQAQTAGIEFLEAKLALLEEELRTQSLTHHGWDEKPLTRLLTELKDVQFLRERLAFVEGTREAVWRRMKNDAMAMLAVLDRHQSHEHRPPAPPLAAENAYEETDVHPASPQPVHASVQPINAFAQPVHAPAQPPSTPAPDVPRAAASAEGTDAHPAASHSASNAEADPTDEVARTRKVILESYWKMRDALDSFFNRDIVLYPIMRNSEMALELRPVRFARISPTDAELFMPNLSPQDKLAGETLAHFGGFLSEKWRGNDLTWGRLDAAEILIRNLFPRELWEEQGKALVRRAQQRILEDMERRGMPIYDPPTERNREHLIGRQDISVIPRLDRINWSLRALLALTAMFSRPLHEIGLAKYLPHGRGPVKTLLRLGIHSSYFIRKRPYLTICVLIITLMLVAFYLALWWTGRAPWPR
jgi:patatin-related protein